MLDTPLLAGAHVAYDPRLRVPHGQYTVCFTWTVNNSPRLTVIGVDVEAVRVPDTCLPVDGALVAMTPRVELKIRISAVSLPMFPAKASFGITPLEKDIDAASVTPDMSDPASM